MHFSHQRVGNSSIISSIYKTSIIHKIKSLVLYYKINKIRVKQKVYGKGSKIWDFKIEIGFDWTFHVNLGITKSNLKTHYVMLVHVPHNHFLPFDFAIF